MAGDRERTSGKGELPDEALLERIATDARTSCRIGSRAATVRARLQAARRGSRKLSEA